MSTYFPPDNNSSENIKVELDFSNYATKKDIKDITSSVKWGLWARNEVGLFQIFNHVKTIKNH